MCCLSPCAQPFSPVVMTANRILVHGNVAFWECGLFVNNYRFQNLLWHIAIILLSLQPPTAGIHVARSAAACRAF